MEFYLYSSQDLFLKDDRQTRLLIGGDISRVKFNLDEKVFIYPCTSQGVMMLSENILNQQQHSQINFHKISDERVLCEIKPFITCDIAERYNLADTQLKLVQCGKGFYIYFNGSFIGQTPTLNILPKFEKFSRNKNEYGVLKWECESNYMVIFNKEKVVYNSSYIDYEINNNYVQIYSHKPNIFNVGLLAKYDFSSEQLTYKTIKDRGEEKQLVSNDFCVIYFLEAIKCKRFKYASSKLSYELKAIINLEVLEQYFTPFDNYIYLDECQAYITTKNDKIVGVYHFVIKDNLIENIY